MRNVHDKIFSRNTVLFSVQMLGISKVCFRCTSILYLGSTKSTEPISSFFSNCNRKKSLASSNGTSLPYLEFYKYLKYVSANCGGIMNSSNSHGKLALPTSLIESLGNDFNRALLKLEILATAVDDLEQRLKDLEDVTSLMLEVSGNVSVSESNELNIIAEEEKSVILKEIYEHDERLQNLLLQEIETDNTISSIVMEVSPGIGGQEAMLFASDLFQMYQLFCSNMGQDFEVLEYDESELGGVHKASATITFSTKGFYHIIRHESGIHRVQRVPATERSGRIHTSTASVALLPVFDNHLVSLEEKDVEIKVVKKSNSSGGQHANKVESGVRVKHLPTGMIVMCNETRSQHENKVRALKNLALKLSLNKSEKQETELFKARRRQVKNKERSDKIRTYNYNHDTVIDHRIKVSVHNISAIMTGQSPLLNIMNKLEEKHQLEELDTIITTLLDEGRKYYQTNFFK